MDIAIEIGSSNTSIFVPGNGIALHEPTMVAFFANDRSNRRVRATGKEAQEMQGRAPENTDVVCPVRDGLIVDPDACVCMLRAFLRKILPERGLLPPRIHALLAIPTGLDSTSTDGSLAERRMFEDVCSRAGISRVTMVESIITSAVGIDLPIHTATGGFVVNIGGALTDIAALSVGGIVSGCNINIGGQAFDSAIIDMVAGKYQLKIGLQTARKLKHEIASLYVNDTSHMSVNGVDMRTKSPGSITVLATDIGRAMLPLVLQIVSAIASTINSCPTEIAAAINSNGIHLVGGSSPICGLDKVLSDRLGLRVTVADDPMYASILGAGRLVGERGLLDDILSQN